MAKPRMHLGFDLSYCHMGGRWLMPGAWPGREFPDIEMYEEAARIAERGCLDMSSPGMAPARRTRGAAIATPRSSGA